MTYASSTARPDAPAASADASIAGTSGALGCASETKHMSSKSRAWAAVPLASAAPEAEASSAVPQTRHPAPPAAAANATPTVSRTAVAARSRAAAGGAAPVTKRANAVSEVTTNPPDSNLRGMRLGMTQRRHEPVLDGDAVERLLRRRRGLLHFGHDQPRARLDARARDD